MIKHNKLPRKHLPGEKVRQRMLKFERTEKIISSIFDLLFIYILAVFIVGILLQIFTKSERFAQIEKYADFIVNNLFLTAIVFAIVIIFFIVISFFIASKITELFFKVKYNDLKQGWIGEAAVGDALATAGRDNWKTYHAITMDNKADIDHVLVCQRGVFCLETKTVNNKDKKIILDGEDVRLGNTKMPMQPLPQARNNALWLHKKIKSETGINKFVIPIVVLPFGQVRDKNHPDIREYTYKKDGDRPFIICSNTGLHRFLKYFGEIVNGKTKFSLTDREIEDIGNMLDGMTRIE